jgi:hypothetical protein
MIDPIEDAKRSVDPALDLWEAPEVSAGFDRRLYRRIEQDVPWWRRIALLPQQRLAPVAAAAILLIAASLWVGRPGAVPTVVPRSAAIEALPPDQAEDALQEMQMIEEFNRLVRSDLPADRKM